MLFELLGNPLLALALVLPRVIGAFLMLPLMTQQTVPAMVRNSFMVSLGIMVLPAALAGARWASSHAGKSAASCTTTGKPISACDGPQNSAQTPR